MNIFEDYLKKINNLILLNKELLDLKNLNDFKNINVESPPIEFNCDLSCNVCLVLSKLNQKSPHELAIKIRELIIKNIKDFEEISIAGPGFLNMKLSESAIISIINKIFKNKDVYGATNSNSTYNIEFVSANPTGPLHVGHCRGAVYGDVLANLLKFNGNKVTKEYYINDYGKQIQNFVESIFLRIREIKYKEKFLKKEHLYPGLYIVEIAKEIIEKNKTLKFDNFNSSFELLKKESLNLSMVMIKSDLSKLGIKHDHFFSESDLVKKKLVNQAVDQLKKNNYVQEGYLDPPKGEINKDWKKVKRLIFKSTLFNDDADRALQKTDGSWTYFANDVAYHMDKVNRNYKYLVNILGADHTGYIKRITAAVSALSNGKVKLNCKVCQLVKLYKKGIPFKMSKRAGDFISVQDLLNEVNKDSVRFMMLNRSNDIELDFDFDKIKEKTKDNPVFYVQYAFARINSLLRTLDKKLHDKINLNEQDLNFNNIEEKIIRKVYEWPKIIESTSKKFELHKIPFYLYEVSTLFHAYWSKGNEDKNYKFIENNKIKRVEIIAIMNLVATVIQNGMKILGVSLPKKM